MNHLDFFQALGDLPERYYSECMPKTRTVRERKRPLWYSVAACAACIGVGFTFGYMFRHHETITESPNPTVSMLTETTAAQIFSLTSDSTEKSEPASAVTTDAEITTLTTELTTIVIIPVHS